MDDSNSIRLTRDAYTVGWVCVLDSEQIAARALLDEEHVRPPTPCDENSYIVGRMGKHNVVIARPVGQGKANAADAAVNMTRSFPQIRFGLMVGVGGGATDSPDPYFGKRDIRLGDVVVSKPHGEHGGIVQYDMGKRYPDGYKIISHLDKPKSALIAAANALQSHHRFKKGNMEKYVQDAITKLRDLDMPYFGFPGREHDLLFRADYRHPDEGEDCSNCDRTQIVDRTPRPRDSPSVHYGLIASADLTIQDPVFRDELRKSKNVLCFEKEAAGLMDRFPCIAIRGISDYADTHKCKKWQPYAAVTAAAFAKDLLAVIQPQEIAEETAAVEVLQRLKERFGKIHTALDTKNRHKVLDWLSTLDFKTEQEGLFGRSVPTGGWLLESDVFRRWVEGSRWQLRCYGEPGTGKTNLCAIVVDHLQKAFGLRRPVIYLYLSDDEHKRVQQTPDHLLGSMLKQLIWCDPNVDIPQKLIEAYEGCGNGAYSTREIMKQAFQDSVAKQDRVYLIVDGLNQCSPEVSELIKEYALGLVQDGLPLSLLTTSLGRNLPMYVHCDCHDGRFDLCLDCKEQGIACPKNHNGEEPYDTVQIEVRPQHDELAEYCHEIINRALKTGRDRRDERVHPSPKYDPRPVARYLRDKPGLVNRISRKIAENAQFSYIVAQAWLQNLLEKDTEPETDEWVLCFLDQIPVGPLTAYLNERIAKLRRYKKESELRVAFTTLTLVMSACQPLTLSQLQHALALKGLSNLNDRVFILKSTNGLISVDIGKESDSFVYFFHGTLRTRAEYKMAKWLENCENITAYPFLSYALEFWGDHVRKANDRRIENAAIQFLKDPIRFARLTQEAAKCGPEEYEEWIHEAMDILHLCAWFGLTNMVNLLITENHDVGIRDHKYRRTPLRYACINGHVETVEELLKHNTPVEEEAVIDAMCGLPCADYLQSEQERRQKIIEELLETGNININARLGAKSRTVLMLAVGHGHYDFVKVFLTHQSVDVDAQDLNGFTALSFAVYSEEGLPIESFDAVADHVYSPRCKLINNICYEGYRCQGLVKLLLQHGANPNMRDNASNSTLILTIRLGALDIVETLLKCERLDLQSEKELVHTASAMGHPEIIRLLHSALSQSNKTHVYNINTMDERGLTPLHYASLSKSARAGEVAEVLLELGANPNVSDSRGCTPYMMAFLLQQTPVIEVLYSKTTSLNGETRSMQDLPALTLAKHGHWALLQEVITTGRNDLIYKCMLTGDTLLHMATTANETDILHLLLIRSKLRPDSAVNEQGHTPLHLARSVEIAKLLVENGYHVSSTDLNNNTPLDIASREPNTRDVAQYLENQLRISAKKHGMELWEQRTKSQKTGFSLKILTPAYRSVSG
ncbi:ankyrin repeat-containing domain protein [Aspergillus novoparasiticus]|uniref:Ankyrin repeat-containing domain protein n=1 Tax=Aspergillus novoparasiticus TaxID=986946 RepID=A0A5N6F7X6_9EURO|nr:ankyrin repeat-containing domain protein [Aspergillus novoparasiticus]